MMQKKSLIEEFYIRGLRCIKDITGPIRFDESLTVLYGPNSVGKSTILQGMSLLLHLIYGTPYTGISLENLSKNLNSESNVIELSGKIQFFDENIEITMSIEFIRGKHYIYSEKAITKIGDIRFVRDLIEGLCTIEYRGMSKVYDCYDIIDIPFLIVIDRPRRLVDGFLSKEIIEKIRYDLKINNDINLLYKLHEKAKIFNTFRRTLESSGYQESLKIIDNGMRSLVTIIEPQSRDRLIENVNNNIIDLRNKYGDKFIRKFEDFVEHVTGDKVSDILIKDDKTYLEFNDEDESCLSIDSLSTGYLNVLNIVTNIIRLEFINKEISEILENVGLGFPRSLLIIDTPEYNIHIDWLINLLDYIMHVENVQTIVETHNGVILSFALSRGLRSYYISREGYKINIKELTRDIVREKLPELFEHELKAYQQILW